MKCDFFRSSFDSDAAFEFSVDNRHGNPAVDRLRHLFSTNECLKHEAVAVLVLQRIDNFPIAKIHLPRTACTSTIRLNLCQGSSVFRIEKYGEIPVPVASIHMSSQGGTSCKTKKPLAGFFTQTVSPGCISINALVSAPPTIRYMKNSSGRSPGELR